jgi:integrase
MGIIGIRRNELLSHDWDDIDFGTNTIKVRKGKGKKPRIIPITDH